mmetsp:Transcript_14979/g.29919  ORF Transcript_14979/g.29919 Transcript_14979/m.29919 type:complete len:83 (-) Transcript_14979:398-646(-)
MVFCSLFKVNWCPVIPEKLLGEDMAASSYVFMPSGLRTSQEEICPRKIHLYHYAKLLRKAHVGSRKTCILLIFHLRCSMCQA